MKVTTKLRRKMASGMTQRNGAAAMFVERCAVTAMRSADGTKAKPAHSIRSRHATSAEFSAAGTAGPAALRSFHAAAPQMNTAAKSAR